MGSTSTETVVDSTSSEHDIINFWRIASLSKGSMVNMHHTPRTGEPEILQRCITQGLFESEVEDQPWWVIDTSQRQEEKHSTLTTYNIELPDTRGPIFIGYEIALLDAVKSSIKITSNIVMKYYDSKGNELSQDSIRNIPEYDSAKRREHELRPPRKTSSMTVTLFVNGIFRCRIAYGRFTLSTTSVQGTAVDSVWSPSSRPSVTMFVFNNFKNDTRVLREAKVLKKMGFDVRIIAVYGSGTKKYELIEGIQVLRLHVVPFHLRAIRACKIMSPVRGMLRLLFSPFLLSRYAFESLYSKVSPIRGRAEVKRRRVNRIKTSRGTSNAIDRQIRRFAEWITRRVMMRFHRYLMFLKFYQMAFDAVNEDPSIVYHAHDLNTLRVGAKAAKAHGAKLVYDSHELYVDRNRARPAGFLKRNLLLRFEKGLIRQCDLTITVNDSIAELLAERYDIPMPTVVMNTPPMQSFDIVHDERIDLRKIISVKKSHRLGIYVGTIQRNRGLEELVRSLAYLDDVHLVLMGYGNPELLEELSEIAEQTSTQDRFSIYGPVPSEQVPQYASSADFGVAPIINACLSYFLCSPNKVFEYMHAGLPVAASDFPELRKLVLSEEIGVVFDPEDPEDMARVIADLLENKESFERMRKNTVKAAKIYHWGRQSDILMSEYRKLLSDDVELDMQDDDEDQTSFRAIFRSTTDSEHRFGPVLTENAIPGEGAWGVPEGSESHGIFEALIPRTQLQPSDLLEIYCSADIKLELTARIYRIGWYDSRGSRQLKYLGTKIVRANQGWKLGGSRKKNGVIHGPQLPSHPTFSYIIDQKWTPGTYVVQITDMEGRKNIHPFWVNDLNEHHDTLVIVPTIANQLYNKWGGSRFYQLTFEHGTRSLSEMKTLYDLCRPFRDSRAGRFSRWVLPFVRWSERVGLDCNWVTDEALHTNPTLASDRKSIILLGDSRYWTRNIHHSLSRHLEDGGNLVNLGCGMGEQLIEITEGRKVRCIPSMLEHETSPLYNYWSPPGSPYQFGDINFKVIHVEGRAWAEGDPSTIPIVGCWDKLKETSGPRIYEIVYQFKGEDSRSRPINIDSTLTTYPNGAKVFHAALENWCLLLDGGVGGLEADYRMQDFIKRLILDESDGGSIDILNRNIHTSRLLAAEHWGAIPCAENTQLSPPATKSTIPRICILTAVWKRPELTAFVLKHFALLREELSDELEITCVAVGSEGKISRELVEFHGFEYIEHPNKPLSDKWDAGLKHTQTINPDAVLIMGSDDMISADTVRGLCSYLFKGRLMVGLLDMYVLDKAGSELSHWDGYESTSRSRQWETIGLARCLSKRLLESLNYSIWGDLGIDRGLDGAMTRRLAEVGLLPLPAGEEVLMTVGSERIAFGHVGLRLADIGGFAMDVKSSMNLSSLESYQLENGIRGDEAYTIIEEHLGTKASTELSALQI